MADPSSLVEVKSKFDAEFRRFSLDRAKYGTFESFRDLLRDLHLLRQDQPGSNLLKAPLPKPVVLAPEVGPPSTAPKFHISYIDPKDNDLLPINNTDNYQRALKTAKPILRLVVQRQGELQETYYSGRRVAAGHSHGGSSLFTSMLGGNSATNRPMISISHPSEFRQVAAIIDPDQVPETCRRVRLLKHGSDKPLGFYIRDGNTVRVTPTGVEKVRGIFISRLVAGGLAESTGLLAPHDEVLEVNGIEVVGKSLDQVTDMMVANSSNLIITVKPANQQLMTMGAAAAAAAAAAASAASGPPRRGSFSRHSNLSKGSSTLSNSDGMMANDHDDEDEVRDLTSSAAASNSGDFHAAASSAISGFHHHHHHPKKPVLHL